MRRKSEETKDRLGMGTGEGAGYKPRIEGRELKAQAISRVSKAESSMRTARP